MIREHPRFQKTAIIFISAIHLTDLDRLRGYEMGAVDYVPVPVVPEVLRAKVRVFAELYRKTRQLERLNARAGAARRRAHRRAGGLDRAAACRARSAAASRSPPARWARGTGIAATGDCAWDDGQYRIFGVDPERFDVHRRQHRGADSSRGLAAAAERDRPASPKTASRSRPSFASCGPNGEVRWCIGTAAASVDAHGRRRARISGVTVDITDRKEAEERQALLAREVDHRAKQRAGGGAVDRAADPRRTTSTPTSPPSKAASGRCRARTRCCRRSRWQGADLARPGRGGACAVSRGR